MTRPDRPLTPKRQALIDALTSGVLAGTWERIPAVLPTWRHLVTVDTPAAIRDTGVWADPTHTRMLFLSISPGASWRVILGNAPAPWVGRRDRDITLTRALQVVAEPSIVWEER